MNEPPSETLSAPLRLPPSTKLASFEICQGCNGLALDFQKPSWNCHWIVCEASGENRVGCGAAYHRGCISVAPRSDIPLPKPTNPNRLNLGWESWACPKCRPVNSSQCYVCKKFYASMAPAESQDYDQKKAVQLGLPKALWNGYLTICPDCKPACVDCGNALSMDRALQAIRCRTCLIRFNQGHRCSVCLRTYDPEGDDDEDMIWCDDCHFWIHNACTGMNKFEIKHIARNDASYSCPCCVRNEQASEIVCCANCQISDERPLISAGYREDGLSILIHYTCRLIAHKAPILSEPTNSFIEWKGHQGHLLHLGRVRSLFLRAFFPLNGASSRVSRIRATYSLSRARLEKLEIFVFSLTEGHAIGHPFPFLHATNLKDLSKVVDEYFIRVFHMRRKAMGPIESFILGAESVQWDPEIPNLDATQLSKKGIGTAKRSKQEKSEKDQKIDQESPAPLAEPNNAAKKLRHTKKAKAKEDFSAGPDLEKADKAAKPGKGPRTKKEMNSALAPTEIVLPPHIDGSARTRSFERPKKVLPKVSDANGGSLPKPPAFDQLRVPLRSGDSIKFVHLGMAFRHLSMQSRRDLWVGQSGIAGLGLFAARRYVPNELVIEYIGEIIGNALADRRESITYGPGTRFADSCYMFRLDDHRVIDATVRGNAARFINHCCQPNCRTRPVTIDGTRRILIIAQRHINTGEELSYDYQFALEPEKGDKADEEIGGDAAAGMSNNTSKVSKRIPCYCGAPRCRNWMN